MRRLALVLLLTGLFLILTAPVKGAVPPRPEQPRPDIFPSGTASIPNLQVLNPVTVNAKLWRGAAYRLVTEPGCSTGTIPADLHGVEAELRKVDFTFYRDDTNFNFTIHITCGSAHIALCGAINIFCLPYGFPYNPDVAISDILSTYQPETRVSILLHENTGHAIGTFNEQYCAGPNDPVLGCTALFSAPPNWRDFMSTGEQSRHGFEDIELERWDRVMYTAYPAPFNRCNLNEATPCVGFGYDPRYGYGVWFCGVDARANVVSLATDDGVQGDGYWLASKVDAQLDQGRNGCDGWTVQPPPAGVLRCWYVLENSKLSYPAYAPWTLSGCLQG